MEKGGSRRRFPSGKQALVIFFGILVLSVTTCMTVVVVWGEQNLSETGAFLFLLVFYVATFAPLIGFAVLVMYFVRRRSSRRQKGPS
jgi:NADH:ubiquinone oxidoreductase subunit K